MAQRREYKGGAAQARLSAGVNSSATTFNLDVSTNWPTGSIGPFLAVIDPGQSNEEKVIFSGRSGTTLTVATSGRGADGTTATSHAVNAVVRHILGATDIDLVNQHAADTSLDDHTQYMHISTARTVSANHNFTDEPIFSDTPHFTGTPDFSGNPLFSGTPHFSGTPTFDNMGVVGDVSTVDAGARAAGTSPKPARADHKHNIDLTAIRNSLIPAGTLLASASGSTPDGFVLCDGQALSRLGYPALFTAIGTGYGAGDGSTTFNVPDLRDRFLGMGGGSRSYGASGGADTVTLSTGNMPSHNHGINDPGHGHSINDPGHKHGADGDTGNRWIVTGGSNFWVVNTFPGGAAQVVTITDIDPATTGISINGNTTGISTQNAGSGSAFSIVPKYFASRIFIKAH